MAFRTLSMAYRHTPSAVHLQDLSYTVDSNSAKHEKATLLKGVSGYFEPGQMTAVVGHHTWDDTSVPAGAGAGSGP